MKRLVSSSCLLLSIGLSGLLVAQTPELNAKLGLWEMTMTMEMSGMPPGVDTSKMTPEQIAQAQAMMRGRGPMPPMTMKQCLTKEKLQNHNYTPDRPGTTCTSKVTKTTSTSVDMVQTCTGANPSTNEMHVEATSPTTMKMTAKQTSGRNGGGGPITVTMNGKWLQADCGDVK